MRTIGLTKTNLCIKGNIEEIENFLGKEIDSIYNYKVGYERSYKDIMPNYNLSMGSMISKNYRPFSMINRDYKFDNTTGIMTVRGRDKYKREFKTATLQLEKVGYKLPTTQLSEGYIWSNAVLMDIT